MRTHRNGRRGLMALAMCTVFSVGCTASEGSKSPTDAINNFYSIVRDSQVTGAPTPAQLVALESHLSRELLDLLQAAGTLRDSEAAAHPDEKPPFVEGDLFSSLFEGPTSVVVLAGAEGLAARRLPVQFTHSGGASPVTWVDTVVVEEENGRLVVADVVYGGTWAFANRGSLLATLRATFTPNPPGGQPPAIPWALRLDGFGPIRVGMTLVELEQLLGGTARIERIEPEDACGYAYLSTMPPGTSVMLDGTTVVRVNVDTTGIPTESGIGVGDTERDVLARYAGYIRVEEHPYTGPEGHYLIVEDPARPGYRLILETDGEVVISFRAGRLPEVDLIEGCA